MEKQKLNSNAVEKALCILMAFYPRNSEMGTVDLSRKTGFHIATVNRILQILARNRFLSQNPLTRKFNLGPSVFALGEAAIDCPWRSDHRAGDSHAPADEGRTRHVDPDPPQDRPW